jgi:hypothetical protein
MFAAVIICLLVAMLGQLAFGTVGAIAGFVAGAIICLGLLLFTDQFT